MLLYVSHFSMFQQLPYFLNALLYLHVVTSSKLMYISPLALSQNPLFGACVSIVRVLTATKRSSYQTASSLFPPPKKRALGSAPHRAARQGAGRAPRVIAFSKGRVTFGDRNTFMGLKSIVSHLKHILLLLSLTKMADLLTL